MPFKFNRLTLLANIFSLQFTEISEYQPSSSYRASKSRFSPYIHCKFCRVCPTTKMTSATVKPSIRTQCQKTCGYRIFQNKTKYGHSKNCHARKRYNNDWGFWNTEEFYKVQKEQRFVTLHELSWHRLALTSHWFVPQRLCVTQQEDSGLTWNCKCTMVPFSRK